MTIRDELIKKGLINKRNKNLDKLEEVLDKLNTHYLKNLLFTDIRTTQATKHGKITTEENGMNY